MDAPSTNDAPAASVTLPKSIAGKMRNWASSNQPAAAQKRLAAAEARVARHNASVVERQRTRIRWHVGKLVSHLCKFTSLDEAQVTGLLREELTRLHEDRLRSRA